MTSPKWASKTGPATAELVDTIITSRAHVEQGYRACLGIMRLGEAHGSERLEAAATRALAIGASSYKSVASILKTGLDRLPLSQTDTAPIDHANIRGADYYAGSSPQTTADLLGHRHLQTEKEDLC